ncbi:hypothetical protein BK659_20400 [Pseudomonas brassicacearum]|uniref:Uncharacterized protein n=1 Tax=Pseudomonas brassicacearum TaxID=930166 RepID=A0A423H3E0_9PSED|nr:hypothetical protein [Pseudomonas brassicacearum]RON06649.1 hypothetical protein BK659_20400 [Pseudomonas brassicacearum]
MDCVEIVVVKNGRRELAKLFCDSKKLTINFVMADGYSKTYFGTDFYECFGHVREEHSDMVFLCKGAKINVHPSSMSSQMSLGVKAYELTMGKYASRSDLVNIFDYEEENLTNDPNVQRDFYMRWVESDISEE